MEAAGAVVPNDGSENEVPVLLGVEELGKSELEPNKDVVGAVDVEPPNKEVPVVPVDVGWEEAPNPKDGVVVLGAVLPPKPKGEEVVVLLAPKAGVVVVDDGAPNGEGVDEAPKPNPVEGVVVDGAPKGELVVLDPNKEVVGAEEPNAGVCVEPVAPNGEGVVVDVVPNILGVDVLAPKTELVVEVLGAPNPPNAEVVVDDGAPNGVDVVVDPNNELDGAGVDAPNAGVLNEEPPKAPV